jgi:hypothetical protein
MSLFSKLVCAAAAAAVAVFSASSPASAKQTCGWYAVAFCSKSEAATTAFINKGWGVLIVTSAFSNFPKGQFCGVSGPQSKASAERDRRAALKNGVSKSVTVRRSCADSAVFNDD